MEPFSPRPDGQISKSLCCCSSSCRSVGERQIGSSVHSNGGRWIGPLTSPRVNTAASLTNFCPLADDPIAGVSRRGVKDAEEVLVVRAGVSGGLADSVVSRTLAWPEVGGLRRECIFIILMAVVGAFCSGATLCSHSSSVGEGDGTCTRHEVIVDEE